MDARRFVIAAASVAAVAAVAAGGAAAKTRTYSSGNVHVVVPGNDHGRLSAIKVPDKGGIQDVDVKVRAIGGISNLYAYVISPKGQSVAIDEEGADDGSSLGSGANDCGGTPTTFNDEAATPIGSGTAPYAGQFQPLQPLTPFDGHQMAGRWSLVLLNYNNGPISITLGCWKLKIKS